MAALKDLLAYLLQNYPHKSELSNARVTKMIYLCDWKHSIDYGSQITDIDWYFDNYGPFVWNVVDTAKENPDLFSVGSTYNFYGDSKRLLSMQAQNYNPKLSLTEEEVADHVIAKTKMLTWNDFISLIYSTFPVVSSERYEVLDLPKLADEYKKSPMFIATAAI